MKRAFLLLLPAALLVCAGPGLTQTPGESPAAIGGLPPPGNVNAGDTPLDGGGSITVSWEAAEGASEYRIERAEEDGDFAAVEVVSADETSFADNGVADGVSYSYRVVSLDIGGVEAASQVVTGVRSAPQWFVGDLLGVALAVLAFAGVVVWYIQRARRGEHLFIRRIAGLEAVDEAVGRATEMGRAVLYIPGTGRISEMGSVASLNLLGEIAKKTAEFGTEINVPNKDPVIFTVAREVVKGAYTAAGRPDAYDPNSVYFVAENALAYAAAVNGIMVREKPATNFLMGPFHAESLILAETGASTGAIQIAGTDQVSQLPFFIVACDYTLMGEELYAASAYLAREPLMLGALKGEDMGKLVFGLILVVGTILSLIFGIDAGIILSTSGY
ncbi:DUF6754 domain-containing protein [Candidatus Eisenbacteria bacterium]|uniref:DUF6754 domain-containing protein n=1 Tax=Eiseniibacteriota bacterium TaxID=2212470 RepID=A0ABV6YIS9_UNCEI